jgi:hypothetical protein
MNSIWKKVILAGCMTAVLSSGMAGAADLSAIGAKSLPRGYSCVTVPGSFSTTYLGEPITYEMGQVSFTNTSNSNFYAGSVYQAVLPPSIGQHLLRYFKVNLTAEDWAGLTQLNNDLRNPDSQLSKDIRRSMGGWVSEMTGEPEGEHLSISFSEFEPIRKVSSNSLLYTAGGVVTIHSDGFIIPMYTRVYFMKDGGDVRTLLLVAANEGKQPLLYAIDDMAKEMYQEILDRDDNWGLDNIQ